MDGRPILKAVTPNQTFSPSQPLRGRNACTSTPMTKKGDVSRSRIASPFLTDKSAKTSSGSCRFIPNRQTAFGPLHEQCARKLFGESSDIVRKRERAGLADSNPPQLPEVNDADPIVESLANALPVKTKYDRSLMRALFDENPLQTAPNILQFSSPVLSENRPCRTNALLDNLLRYRNTGRVSLNHRFAKLRHICSTADRILDSPDLVDDYYLNPLHWGSQNIVAVALSNTVYLWNAITAKTSLFFRTSSANESATSLRWSDDGHKLAIGTSSSGIELLDVETRQRIQEIQGHNGRVSVLAWKPRSKNIFTSGGRDSSIKIYDLRQANCVIGQLNGHMQEVCGLQWSSDGTQLASGANDNLAMIWDVKAMTAPRLTLDKHRAAVKAIAWCPFQDRLLATGGGTADRCIRFWNSSTGSCIGGVDTQSQVCGLVWNAHEKELLSAHGFSKNQLTIWNYPTMTRIADLTGHTARVLHLTLSPDSTTVCSASADETLRFWKVFRSLGNKKPGTNREYASSQTCRSFQSINIR
uniref:CDC20/Fizzy WD40 domain-containing protein n=1 Tax=Spongospora subterranea TaxID=70186 RepID=A0A0H5RRL4_9EUKA|eukprot:CRZ11354.1 hypothetical protein [Spongospora subterranea]